MGPLYSHIRLCQVLLRSEVADGEKGLPQRCHHDGYQRSWGAAGGREVWGDEGGTAVHSAVPLFVEEGEAQAQAQVYDFSVDVCAKGACAYKEMYL